MSKHEDIEKIRTLVKHIKLVQLYAEILGIKLIEAGDEILGRTLIANSMKHDLSKFHGIEWDHLGNDSDELLKETISQHNRTNMHHPEFWGGIEKMPSLYLAEMVCDWKARSAEFGTDIKKWLDGTATKKYSFKKSSKVYDEVLKYIDLVIDKAFS